EDTGRPTLPESHLHRLRHAEADAVRRPGDVPRQEPSQSAWSDLVQQERSPLRDRDDLLRHEEDVAGAYDTDRVLGDDRVEVVARHDHPCADGDACETLPLHCDLELLAVVRLFRGAHSR
ncbi:hypothetical protein ABE10_02615, partial [Bacillus toyonensis]|nr:hypothetical protein [Bacillus toyonensis]